VDPSTGLVTSTVNADSLLAANPFTDVSQYKLVDASTDPVDVDPSTGLSTDPNLELTTNNALLTERYDDLKVQAILNEIYGQNSMGTAKAPTPNLFAMNFQAVSVAEKYYLGGIAVTNGTEMPSAILEAAIQHTDTSIGQIVGALKATDLWNSTL